MNRAAPSAQRRRAGGAESRKRATHSAASTLNEAIAPRKYDSPAPHLATPSAAMLDVRAYSAHGDQQRRRIIHTSSAAAMASSTQCSTEKFDRYAPSCSA